MDWRSNHRNPSIMPGPHFRYDDRLVVIIWLSLTFISLMGEKDCSLIAFLAFILFWSGLLGMFGILGLINEKWADNAWNVFVVFLWVMLGLLVIVPLIWVSIVTRSLAELKRLWGMMGKNNGTDVGTPSPRRVPLAACPPVEEGVIVKHRFREYGPAPRAFKPPMAPRSLFRFRFAVPAMMPRATESASF
jgi:hypothetical protein